MNARIFSLAGLVLLAACTPNGFGEEAEAAARVALTEHVTAMVADDWERVYELTAVDQRPTDRAGWLGTRQSDGFVHKCVGEPTGRPEIELDTLSHDQGSAFIQAILWVQSDQGRVCRWQLTTDPDGHWRVVGLVPHEQTVEGSS